MRKKKGFTLIELLAVIVILAIIALIAVPVILNIIDKANKSAFKDSAYGVIQAAEYYYAASQLDLEGPLVDVEMKTTDPRLELTGKVPVGDVKITRDGEIAIAIKNDRYCVTKGYNDTDITITENPEDCEITVKELVLGQEIYYNPVTNQICENYTEANSETGVKTGCMKWYIYKMEDDNVGLILDHNTTALTKWNETGNNADGPTTLNAVLKADTTDQGWKVNASVITIDELMNMLPWYQNLTDKSNWTEEYITYFSNAVNTIMETIGANADSYANTLEMYKAMTNMLMTDYPEIALPSYLHEDLYGNCDSDCLCTTYGYWTSDAVAGYALRAWDVTYDGIVDSYTVISDIVGYGGSRVGLRPVISLSKSAIQ